MDNMIYQLRHPWHWLTYGQNSTALAAIAALAGLIGLFFYTRYTRRMMRLQEQTSRASITPVLISRGGVRFEVRSTKDVAVSEIGLGNPVIGKCTAILDVRNIGEGVALFLSAWCQPISEAFNATDTSFLHRTNHATAGSHQLLELFKGERTVVSFEGFEPEDLQRRFLFVVEALDQSNGQHQLKIAFSGAPNGKTSVTMAHKTGNSFGERIVTLVNRYVEILNSIQEAVDKL